MNIPTCGKGLCHCHVERTIGGGFTDSDFGGLGCHRRLRTHPDDVSNLHIIGVEGLFPVVQIYYGRHSRLIQTEIIQPGRILSEFVGIVLVLGCSFDVSYE